MVRTPKEFIPIDLLGMNLRPGTHDLSYVADAGYSNLAISPSAPVFRSLLQFVASSKGVSAERIVVRMLLPQEFANYLAWKVLGACRHFSLKPAGVIVVNTCFRQTSSGQWVFEVLSVLDRTGRLHRMS